MKRLTEEDIININKSLDDSWNQGIYKEPFGVESIKDYVIYQRHETGGVSGGSCWDSSDPQPYYNDKKRPNWDALDEVLKLLCPEITYLKYKGIKNLITSTDETDWEYYGNRTNYDIWYLPLETLYKYLGI